MDIQMRKVLISVFLVSTFFISQGQKFKSTQSTVVFFSEAAIEDIAATNSRATSLFDASTGEVAFLVPIGGFQFEKTLMQQHFNEKYMESHKFPTASFEGKITGFEKAMKGSPTVHAKGKLTIHGQTKEVEAEGTIAVVESGLVLTSSFFVELADYKIKIPRLLWQNIAEKVEVKVHFKYERL